MYAPPIVRGSLILMKMFSLKPKYNSEKFHLLPYCSFCIREIADSRFLRVGGYSLSVHLHL